MIKLANFADIQTSWSGLLLGNGASTSVSSKFSYRSLLEQAKVSNSCPLSDLDIQIFNDLSTKNFEQVLSTLLRARAINTIFGLSTQEVSASYERIQTSLIKAVHEVHIPCAELSADLLSKIREALLPYNYVYSTNYDLLVYWAVNSNSAGFKDYIWGQYFDLGNTEIWDKVTKVLFLHGGLHLYKTFKGTRKRKADFGSNLLDLFGTPFADGEDAVPLFITEGTSTDKLKSIYSNDYLAFAFNRFALHEGPLVVLGQSLSPELDKHLIDGIRASRNRVLGIGIYKGGKSSNDIIGEKSGWYSRFAGFDLSFFDSSTHPLIG